ncbi:transposable element Tcb2 transposase [Trichonephila clavipes]|nr:transposable element Tcb2 transposase [Trichonephila clavipes]
MAGYLNLSEFERGVIVGVHWCTLADCLTQSFTPRLGPSTPTLDVNDWKHVAWSHESRFQSNRADGGVGVWRQHHESMDPTCQQGTVQTGKGSVMVWSVCSWRDMELLIRLDTTLTGDRYVSVLSDHLHQFMSIAHSNGLGDFQQNNMTPHTSRIDTEGLQEHSSEFRHFRWPPKSPQTSKIFNIS